MCLLDTKKKTIHTNQDVANKQNIFVLPPVSLLIVCSACGDQISVYILLPNAGKLKLDKQSYKGTHIWETNKWKFTNTTQKLLKNWLQGH